MKHRIFWITLGLSLSLIISCRPTTEVPTHPPEPPPEVVNASAIPGQMLAAHNEIRAQHGLPALRANAALMETAKDHSAWMAKHEYMTHMGGDGNPWQRMQEHGYSYSAASENVAWNERSVNEVMSAWMNSSGHRANILGDYLDYGGSVAYAADGSPYWTSCFGKPN